MNKKIILLLVSSFFYLAFTSPLLATPKLSKQLNSISGYSWFWFFYEKESQIDYKDKIYRPLYFKNVTPKETFKATLMPILYWSYKTKNKREWKALLGLIGAVDYKHTDGKRDYDFGAFPFFYYGRSKNSSDNYLMFWPLGGTLKGKLGHDEINPYLFPGFVLFLFLPPASFFSYTGLLYSIVSCLPAYMTYRQKEYQSEAIFWPLIQWGKSPKRDDFRIIPFYAHNKKIGFYDNYSYLLFINYRQTFFKKDKHQTFFVTPIFGRKWSRSKRISSFTILWPFFSWGYDRRKGNVEYNLPWPFVQIQNCEVPKITTRIFFPFYGSQVQQNEHGSKETFFLSPLYFSLKRKTRRFVSESYINAFIIWYFKKDFVDNHDYYGHKWRYFKIWPLLSNEFNDQGDWAINIFSLFPFRDEAGYEKMYQPFWTLFEFRRLRTGEKRLGLFFRTYFQRWGDNFFQAKVPLLFTYERNENRLTELSFLLSLFSYTNNREGKYLRVFFLPIRLGEGDASSLADLSLEKKEREEEFSYSHNFLAAKEFKLEACQIFHSF